MKPALGYNEPKTPLHWDEMPNGQYIANEISNTLNEFWPRIFGYHLLKIGELSAEIKSKNTRISNTVNVARYNKASHVIADIDDLPFIQHSVDACLLSHCLEFNVDPHHILREADRVLIPNGHMIITGFNPISLAGINRLIPFRRHISPWNGRFFTPMRVKDWLNLLGYEILIEQRFIHSMLNSTIKESSWWRRCWYKFAQSYLSSFASVYVIVAKKRVLPLTPIRPKWKLRPNFRPVNISTRMAERQSNFNPLKRGGLSKRSSK